MFSPALTGCQQRKGKCFRWKPAVPMLAVKVKGSGNARLKKDSNHSSNEKRKGRLPHIVSNVDRARGWQTHSGVRAPGVAAARGVQSSGDSRTSLGARAGSSLRQEGVGIRRGCRVCVVDNGERKQSPLPSPAGGAGCTREPCASGGGSRRPSCSPRHTLSCDIV